MPKRIEFEGKIQEFPDDFTDADIAAALGAGPATQAGAPSAQWPGAARLTAEDKAKAASVVGAAGAPVLAAGTGMLLGPGVGRIASQFSPSGAALGAGEALLHENRSIPRVLAGAVLGGFGGGLVKRGAKTAGEALGAGMRTGMAAAPAAAETAAAGSAGPLSTLSRKAILDPEEAQRVQRFLELARQRASQEGTISAGMLRSQ